MEETVGQDVEDESFKTAKTSQDKSDQSLYESFENSKGQSPQGNKSNDKSNLTNKTGNIFFWNNEISWTKLKKSIIYRVSAFSLLFLIPKIAGKNPRHSDGSTPGKSTPDRGQGTPGTGGSTPRKPGTPTGKDDKERSQKKSQNSSCKCTRCKKKPQNSAPSPGRARRLSEVVPPTFMVPTDELDGHRHKIIPMDLYNYGEPGCGFNSKGPPQDYTELRTALLEKGKLFEDPEFPCVLEQSVIDQMKDDAPDKIHWIRPHEIVKNPKMFGSGFSKFDAKQGLLGDCWLLAALANLTLSNRQFVEIVPLDQDFENNYAGIFHFRFWHYGRWVDVVVDDRLPVDGNNELLFLKSIDPNEFWSPLLEKAYAKLSGGYSALHGGTTNDATQDFTGGIIEHLIISKLSKSEIEKHLVDAFRRSSFIGCGIIPPGAEEAKPRPDGLVEFHSYCLNKVLKFNTPDGKSMFLLKLRNPWGDKNEWNGPWSENSPEWKSLPKDVKKDLGVVFEADGEFWMSFNDFIKIFHEVDLCHISPDTMSELELGGKNWTIELFEGEWIKGISAGGNPGKYPDTTWTNPQYTIDLHDYNLRSNEECTIHISLIAKKKKKYLKSPTDKNIMFGFFLLLLRDPENTPKPLTKEYVESHKDQLDIVRNAYGHGNETYLRVILMPAVYLIVVTTEKPGQELQFLLRVFSEKRTKLTNLNSGKSK